MSGLPSGIWFSKRTKGLFKNNLARSWKEVLSEQKVDLKLKLKTKFQNGTTTDNHNFRCFGLKKID